MNLLLLAAIAASSPAIETPRAFVERLYAGYRDPDYSPLEKPERVFAPALVAEIREDWRLSRGEVGYMGADPICQCQDATGMRAEIETLRVARQRATARIRLTFPGSDLRAVELKLVRARGGWRIADIASADEASLLGGLRRFNRRRR